MPPVVAAEIPEDDPATFEQTNVHAVYDTIAGHFSSTRYKPWPVIAEFMASLAAGSVGLDSGCGNGKYLPLGHPRVFTVGLDRSAKLLDIAKGAGDAPRDVVLADALDDCWRPGVFDHAISVACLHHLATPARRRLAVESLLRAVSPRHGRALIYVWATEQDSLSKRAVPKHGDDGVATQDVFVPWVHSVAVSGEGPAVLQRYYHLFATGELLQLVHDAVTSLNLAIGSAQDAPNCTQGVEIVRQGWERSNWYVEIRRWARTG